VTEATHALIEYLKGRPSASAPAGAG
jgi:hypothetical protein